MCINSNRNGGKKIGNLSLFSVHTTFFLFGLFWKARPLAGGQILFDLNTKQKMLLERPRKKRDKKGHERKVSDFRD